jgi:hypothetical protein
MTAECAAGLGFSALGARRPVAAHRSAEGAPADETAVHHTVHTAAARERGATREEIAEVLGVAVSVNAGAAVVYSTRALDAFDAAAEINPNARGELIPATRS